MGRLQQHKKYFLLLGLFLILLSLHDVVGFKLKGEGLGPYDFLVLLAGLGVIFSNFGSLTDSKGAHYLLKNRQILCLLLFFYVTTSFFSISKNTPSIFVCNWFQCKKVAVIFSMDEVHASHDRAGDRRHNDWGFYWLDSDSFYKKRLMPLLNEYPSLRVTLGWVPGGYTNSSCSWKNESLLLESHPWNDSVGQEWTKKVLQEVYGTGRFDEFVAHGYAHENFNLLSPAQVEEKLRNIQTAFNNVTGHPATGFNSFPFFEERLDIIPIFSRNGFYHIGLNGEGVPDDAVVSYLHKSDASLILLPYNVRIRDTSSLESSKEKLDTIFKDNKPFAVVRMFTHALPNYSCGASSVKQLRDSLEENYQVIDDLLSWLISKYGGSIWFATDHEAAHYFDVANNIRIIDFYAGGQYLRFSLIAKGTAFEWPDMASVTVAFTTGNNLRPISAHCSSELNTYYFSPSNFTVYSGHFLMNLPIAPETSKKLVCTILLGQ